MTYDTMLDNLHRETALMSSPRMIQNSQAYKTIILHGKNAIEPLINQLKKSPSMPVILALEDITGDRPYKRGASNIRKMANAWVNNYYYVMGDFISGTSLVTSKEAPSLTEKVLGIRPLNPGENEFARQAEHGISPSMPSVESDEDDD